MKSMKLRRILDVIIYNQNGRRELCILAPGESKLIMKCEDYTLSVHEYMDEMLVNTDAWGGSNFNKGFHHILAWAEDNGITED